MMRQQGILVAVRSLSNVAGREFGPGVLDGGYGDVPCRTTIAGLPHSFPMRNSAMDSSELVNQMSAVSWDKMTAITLTLLAVVCAVCLSIYQLRCWLCGSNTSIFLIFWIGSMLALPIHLFNTPQESPSRRMLIGLVANSTWCGIGYVLETSRVIFGVPFTSLSQLARDSIILCLMVWLTYTVAEYLFRVMQR